MKAIRLNRKPFQSRVLNLLLVLFLITASSAFCAGQTGFPVLMELTEARTLALGGAVVSHDGQSGAVLINPASAVGSERQISAAFANHMLDLWSGNITVTYPLNDKLIVGGYLNNYDYGEFDVTHVGEGANGETFTAAEYVIAGYGAYSLTDRIGVGATVKFVWGNIDDNSASGMAVDGGITFDPQWQDIKLGASFRNVGSQLNKYGTNDAPLPTEVNIGGSKKLAHLPLTLSASGIISPTDCGEYNIDFIPGEPSLSFATAGEFKVKPQNSDRPFFLRIGYRSRGQELRVGHSKDILAGMSFGLGIPFRRFKVDYAFASMGALGDVHRFGVTGTY